MNNIEIIDVNLENIEKEHICCAISDKKGECQVSSKKSWLKERFEDGLVFKKANERGKVFIEYIPAENAWCPIEAKGYMYINCFWVSGKFQHTGLGSKLLDECIEDSKRKNKKGLVVLSSKKKKAYLSDGDYLKKKGFLVADEKEPYYELLYLPFYKEKEIPKFKKNLSEEIENNKGFLLYYSNQCPFTSKYVSILENYAVEKNINLKVVKYETKEEAQKAINPFTTYSLYYDNKFITHEILNIKKFEKILEKII